MSKLVRANRNLNAERPFLLHGSLKRTTMYANLCHFGGKDFGVQPEELVGAIEPILEGSGGLAELKVEDHVERVLNAGWSESQEPGGVTRESHNAKKRTG
eukprot:5966715-Amphidinium_carterae.2